jgi:microcystin-dependent protein
VPQYDEEGNPTGETVKQIYNTTMIPLITKAMQELNEKVGAGGGGDTLPIGSVVEWDSDVVPTNWLLLDGQEVSREEYSELFEIYGTRYGEGDGITTFNLPNRCGKVAVGLDTEDSDFNTLGNTGGEKAHTLTVDEMPSHNHKTPVAWDSGRGTSSAVSGEFQWLLHQQGNVYGITTTSTGGGQAHNNLQPYIVVNFIVKAKQSKAILQSGTIIDNLNSDDNTMALSARMGKLLNEKINNVSGGSSSSSLSFEHDGNGNVTINFS